MIPLLSSLMKYTLVIWLSDYSVACQAASLPSPFPPLYLLRILQVGPLKLCRLPFFIIHTYVQSLTQSFIHVCMGSWFLFYSMDNNLSPALLILMPKLPHTRWVGKFSSWIWILLTGPCHSASTSLPSDTRQARLILYLFLLSQFWNLAIFPGSLGFFQCKMVVFSVPRARECIVYIETPVNTWICLCLYLLCPHSHILKGHGNIFHSTLT